MRLHTPDEVPLGMPGRVCRQSRIACLLTSGIIWLFFGGLPLALLIAVQPRWWLAVPALVYVALVTRGLVRSAVAAFRKSNWLLRIAPDGLWINLRSYQNYRFEPAPVVLFVPYAEVADVAEHSVKRSERTRSNRATWTDRYLDVRLREPAIPELGRAIADERLRKVTRELFKTGLKSHSRANHVPVTLPHENLIRISWRGKGDSVVPDPATVLADLAAYCAVGTASERDLENLDALTTDQVDALILERVEQGDNIGAIKLLQERRGYTLTDAKNFVDGLKVKL